MFLKHLLPPVAFFVMVVKVFRSTANAVDLACEEVDLEGPLLDSVLRSAHAGAVATWDILFVYGLRAMFG